MIEVSGMKFYGKDKVPRSRFNDIMSKLDWICNFVDVEETKPEEVITITMIPSNESPIEKIQEVELDDVDHVKTNLDKLTEEANRLQYNPPTKSEETLFRKFLSMFY